VAKRAFDLFVSALLLAVLSPVLLSVAVAVVLSLGRPIFFFQRRPGRHGRIFRIWKFRTMRDARDASGRPLPDAERLSRFGKLLRSTSLDELPELWNVLRGEMSLVGPRPLLVAYLGRYSTTEARRHEVRPGITGWAQVNGRNATSWDDRLSLDVWYVDHRTFWLDIRILLRTVSIVLNREGVNSPLTATMVELRPPDGAGDLEYPRQHNCDTDNAGP
jgi:sugar transferase EpsL